MVEGLIHCFAFGFALGAVFRVGFRFQTLAGDGFAAVEADSVFGIFEPLERLVDLMGGSPRRVFRLGGGLGPGLPADIAVLDLDNEYTIDSRDFLSKGKSTPFDGWRVRGRVVMTLMDGKAVYNSLTK